MISLGTVKAVCTSRGKGGAKQSVPQVLLQRGAAGRMPEAAARLTVADAAGHLDDARETARHHRVPAERPAGGVDPGAVTELERLAQHDLLGAVADAELRHVEGASVEAQVAGGNARRRRIRQVAQAQVVRLDTVIDAADPDRLFAELPCAPAARYEHGRRTVGDRRQVVLAER